MTHMGRPRPQWAAPFSRHGKWRWAQASKVGFRSLSTLECGWDMTRCFKFLLLWPAMNYSLELQSEINPFSSKLLFFRLFYERKRKKTRIECLRAHVQVETIGPPWVSSSAIHCCFCFGFYCFKTGSLIGQELTNRLGKLEVSLEICHYLPSAGIECAPWLTFNTGSDKWTSNLQNLKHELLPIELSFPF